jgi:hypothetical protein
VSSVVVVDGVQALDGMLVVGATNVSGSSDESSAVRATATISTPTRSTAAAPAMNIVAGRLDQCSGSWSGGTPAC